jgi:hypothetical protein
MTPRQLQYLDFDASEDTGGHGSFEAMASVPAARLPALQAEVAAVLAWAHDAFGAPDAEGDWDYALHGTQEVRTPLAVRYDPGRRTVAAAPEAAAAAPVTTFTLTLTGTAAFCDAFRNAFTAAD